VEIRYEFEIPGVAVFTPSLEIPYDNAREHEIISNSARLGTLVFNLGLVELVSYWKAVCAPKVVVKCGALSNEQKLWWKRLYFNGLGEFFYLNKITAQFDDFMMIETEGEEKSTRFEMPGLAGNLVPIGGGKDSIVSLNLLLNAPSSANLGRIQPFIINSRGATLDTVKIAGVEKSTVFATRRLDPQLLDLNARGYLNGHTPFSAVVAFTSLIAAYLNGRKYIVLSNESSANEPTAVDEFGRGVNHQYSKSFEFESAFRNYVAKYLTADIEYFSLLRPLSEYQIAKIFSHLKDYHAVFRSCNVGSKRNIWCGNCPKCLFVYIILAPFLNIDELLNIFGENLLDKPELLDNFYRLIGVEEVKPFECVGSVDEINTALQQISSQYSASSLPFLLQNYVQTEKYRYYRELFDQKIDYYNVFFDEENALPESYRLLLKSGVK
jgi:hypothetical protein